MKRKLLKNIIREIWKSRSRFLAILLIVALGTGFYSGLRASSPDMIATAENYFDEYHLYDLRIQSLSGFDDDFINDLLENDLITNIEERYEIDYIYDNNQNVCRIIYTKTFKYFKLLEGRYPDTENEILISSDHYVIGDKITIYDKEYLIVGKVMSPEYLANNLGKSLIGDGNIDFYIVVNEINSGVNNNLYLWLDNPYSGYDDNYIKIVDKVKLSISSNFNVFDRRNINGYSAFKDDVSKVRQISTVIPFFFALIAILVTLSTMTRMVSEQRLEIGTLSALGYNKIEIALKYFVYAFIASFIGSILGVSLGVLILPHIVFDAYKMTYILPGLLFKPHWDYLLLNLLVATLSTTFASFIACFYILKTVPSQLMRGKSPVAGKKILLERAFFWKKFSFNLKMTIRNLFRYKRRTLITIIGICGCAGLMLTGFGLRNAIINVSDKQFTEILKYDGTIYYNPYKNINLDFLEIEDSLKVFHNNLEIKSDESLLVTLVVPEDTDRIDSFITLRNRKSGKKLELNNEGVIITEKYAQVLGLNVGDEIILIDENNKDIALKTTGITENYLSNYIYISPNLYKDYFDNLYFNSVYIKIKDEEIINKLKYDPNILSINLLSETEDFFSDSTNNLAFITLVIILASGLLAFIVLSNLANINITERVKELSTFKVLGMHDYEVSLYIARENYFSTIIGLAFGLVVGVFFEKYVIKVVESNDFMLIQDIDFFSYLYTVLLTFAFSLIVNIILHFKIKRLDMVSAMKAYE
ncbi:MAG TPA: FtsX-like permease family protein [Acholeplasmataceae bacterium]|nr:FtsX-like permease family protein [Acholeplasmataceae bacterium]